MKLCFTCIVNIALVLSLVKVKLSNHQAKSRLYAMGNKYNLVLPIAALDSGILDCLQRMATTPLTPAKFAVQALTQRQALQVMQPDRSASPVPSPSQSEPFISSARRLPPPLSTSSKPHRHHPSPAEAPGPHPANA